jgi:hypothetical protein
MFVRVETGFKAEFSDPEAKKLHQKIADIHPSLAEKIRWVRKLKVYWIELSAPRDKVVQAIQFAFKNPVTQWLFTGDLLPSAAGSTGTLFDLMQESPYRPGVFHGVEKRKRLQVHDEEALVVLDTLQTILGRKSSQDRVVSGELLLLEGVRLSQSDLEWLARNWFSHEKLESWSLLSEEELKRNSRFQSEQVAKYLMNAQTQSRSRLLQFRQASSSVSEEMGWTDIAEKMKLPLKTTEKCVSVQEEEWSVFPEIRFASDCLQNDTQTELEFNLVKQQHEACALGFSSKLQTVLGVLPEKNRLWLGNEHGSHPVRIREEFETSLKLVAETTATPIVQMKFYEDPHENEPSYFWSSSVAVGNGSQTKSAENRAQGSIVDLFYIGHHEQPAYRNLVLSENIKSALNQCQQGDAIDFSIASTGKSLLEVLKRSDRHLQYGFDLVLDGYTPWFKRFLETNLPISQIWGVRDEKKAWVIEELEARNIPYIHFGSTSLTGDVRILDEGQVRASVTIKDFFQPIQFNPKDQLLDEPLFVQEKRVQPAKFKNRYSIEELVLKPETYHVSVATPVVIRPNLNSWTGIMVLSDLCGQEFSPSYMEYLLRKCTALGGQIHSTQVSMLNGLKSWLRTLESFKSDFGIQLTQFEVKTDPEIQSHWIALQLVSKVNDCRTVRSEDFKYVHDRIYWLPGSFDHPATRWLAGVEGRYQNGLHSAVAIESTEGRQGVINTLTFALLKRKLGAEVRIQHHFAGGFFVSVSENERFAVEEEWRAVGIEFEFVGRITSSPFLVIRDEKDQTQTISIEDLV